MVYVHIHGRHTKHVSASGRSWACSHCKQTEQSYAQQTEDGILTNLPLWSRRPNHRACSTKMPPSQSYKRRCVARQHFPDDQTLWLQAGAGEDDVIHLLSGLDCVVYKRQEEEEEGIAGKLYRLYTDVNLSWRTFAAVPWSWFIPT